MIPIRLIGTQDEGVVESIIRATNRQTEVRAEQFFAVTEFAKQLEAYFRTFANGRKLFYERRSRQYNRLDIERTRIVTPRVAYPVDSGSSIYRQMKPSGQRRFNNNATHLASSENAFWN